ncbi:hypothetical protein KPH14_011542 [Odynerus spinipes]|uniref:Uncharacterized protein n=1 Tax=Odynerus spinipes TaxID=1348599 RepID=A0AAD9RKC2_9HYME|nr:hypothetical protein KPH14_011542 [Odynerus spinipes]
MPDTFNQFKGHSSPTLSEQLRKEPTKQFSHHPGVPYTARAGHVPGVTDLACARLCTFGRVFDEQGVPRDPPGQLSFILRT